MIFLFKNVTLSDTESARIQEFLGQTIEKMLATKEETLNILKRFDLVLICSWEGNYLVVDMYQLSKFSFSANRNLRRKNTPFFTAARSLYQKELIVYFDDHKEKGMMLKNLLAFYYVLDLLTHVEVTVVTSKEFRCIW